MSLVPDQPPPIPNDSVPVWDLVIEDMRERDHVGRARYGTPLQTHNGRDPLVDAYQEGLDLVVYLRQAIAERPALLREELETFLRDHRWQYDPSTKALTCTCGWDGDAEGTWDTHLRAALAER